MSTRPAAAAGHLFMQAQPVPAAVARLEAIGVRAIVKRDTFAVMELRGGTHIVVREPKDSPAEQPSFDLMYDDIKEARLMFEKAGFELSETVAGKVHASFRATAPEGFEFQVIDSHAGSRVV